MPFHKGTAQCLTRSLFITRAELLRTRFSSPHSSIFIDRGQREHHADPDLALNVGGASKRGLSNAAKDLLLVANARLQYRTTTLRAVTGPNAEPLGSHGAVMLGGTLGFLGQRRIVTVTFNDSIP